MSNYPTVYGKWAGNSAGTAPDRSRCCEEVYDNTSRRFHQCTRKRGHGPNGDYCKQHDPAATKARKDAATAAYNAKFNASRYQWHGRSFFEVLRQIAEGHNDPRALAAETIRKFEDGAK